MFVVILILIIICLIIKWKYDRKEVYKDIEKISGPKGVPLLGNIFDVGLNYSQLLTNLYSLQKHYGPVYKLWMGPILKIVITDPDIVQQILASKYINKTDSYNVLKFWIGDSLVLQNAIRKRLMPSFSLKALKGFVNVFNDHCQIMVEQLSKQLDKNIDMLPFMYAVTVDIISNTVLGESFKMQYEPDNKFVKYSDEVLTLSMKRVFSIFKRNDCIYKLLPNNIIIKRQNDLKQQTMQNESLSILDVLLNANYKGADLPNIRSNLHAVLFAGFDTTTVTLCFTLYELAKRPDIQEKLYAESVKVLGDSNDMLITYDLITKMKYLDCVMKETLRLHPTAPYIERKLSEDIYYDKFKIPSGTDVAIFIYGIHLSEKLYKNVHKFDPNRFLPENSSNRHLYAHIPFSAGPRNCIGFVYAEFLFKTVLSNIIRSFRIEAVDGYKPECQGIGVTRIVNGLEVMLKKR